MTDYTRRAPLEAAQVLQNRHFNRGVLTMKAICWSLIAVASLLPGMIGSATASENMREEWREHPRIVKAVHELEDAIKYMEAAPHDFGGHKASAIAASREAVRQLREAIHYRAEAEK